VYRSLIPERIPALVVDVTLSNRDHLTTRDCIPNSKGEALHMQALEAEALAMRQRRERSSE
jgi:hypothetical protein